ncbi:cysteine desulfurase family protein [Nocardioides daeguensis]|uniref:Cysteine desulfurase/sulfurtransferase TusA family protein n=1 Tax=Nocardioides daeguensis TaxID=908359 RepID=A0ABP6UXH7_9ACTN|nr:aminotransferase class V-fold PLP-dependent enzyme [Nocardioides daeguensis]MBV6725778.1 aminotransferase class V-fold PLP-dependent enzyme [Nocardioides daeguensis]MCR1772707.1 aminotransferase class V-fold PLP-dependent enzyme [Nocardioides daeguensis]
MSSTSEVYLDSASSSPLHPAARDTLLAALDRGYGDPRRLHAAGRDARLLLDNARAVVAQCLGARPDEVGFAASGTDAVHRGLLGLTAATGRDGIVHGAVEHSAVLHAAAWRPSPAHRRIPVDALGHVDLAAMAAGAREAGVGAVALQAANQEVGTVQRVDDLDLPAGVPLLVDAAAAAGHAPLPRRWDALTASAHKWGGPAGVGVLVVRRGTRWTNPFPGDDGLDQLGGFPDVPAALAAAAALQAVLAEREEVAARQHALVDRIRAAAANLPDTEVVGDPVARLPHLVTFSCLYVGGDEIVSALARRGFGVASGSACTASTLEPSHVLAAMGALTHGNVRVSLGRDTTAEEVEAFCGALADEVGRIRAEAGL